MGGGSSTAKPGAAGATPLAGYGPAMAALTAPSRKMLEGLPLLAFDLIMLDPAYRFRTWSAKGLKKSPERHYTTMIFPEIAAIPVPLLAKPDAALVLWATWPLLLDAGDPGRRVASMAAHSPVGALIDAWDFRYVTGGAWVKTTVNGKVAFGTGYRARSATEPFLIAIRGNPLNSRGMRNLIEGAGAIRGLRREHSRKPEEVYRWCEAYLPGANRLELFGRQAKRAGWTVRGIEAGMFDPSATEGSP